MEPQPHDGLTWIRRPATSVRDIVQLPGTPYSLLIENGVVRDQELGADVSRLLVVRGEMGAGDDSIRENQAGFVGSESNRRS